MLISETAPASLKQYTGSVRLIHVQEHAPALSFLHHGSSGYNNFDRSSIGSCASTVGAVLAVFCCEFSFKAKIHQRVHTIGCNEYNISAAPAIAAVRAARLYIFFAVKRDATVAAVSGSDADFDLIYKHSVLRL